jgi:hypothetical protein
MSYKFKKLYFLNDVTVRVPKDCGTGLSFWIHEKVSQVVESIPKLALPCDGPVLWLTGLLADPKLHEDWKNPEFLKVDYPFNRALSELDFYQNGHDCSQRLKSWKIIDGYAKTIADALAGSGIHTTVEVRVERYYYKSSTTEDYCSYCSTKRKHKVHTRTVAEKLIRPYWFTSKHAVVNKPEENIEQKAA